jgi:hypothetical protein
MKPRDHDEQAVLEAELRRAIQHRRAAQERAEETRHDLQRLMERAKEMLARRERVRAPAAGDEAP